MNKLLKFCVLGGVIVLVVAYVFKIPLSSLVPFAFLLLCPLMHVFMMHDNKDKKTKHDH